MGFFGKLFEKKECAICGNEVGIIGNRKLEDGNMCSKCTKKLSPWFSERRHSTVAEIKEQIAYRERNAEFLQNFRASKVIGDYYKIYIEEHHGEPVRFFVTDDTDYMQSNPDIVFFMNVVSCVIDIKESRRELKERNSNGEMVSCRPPKYEYQYQFHVILNLRNIKYFDQMEFRLNRSPVRVTVEESNKARVFGNIPFVDQANDPTRDRQYRKYKEMCDQIEQVVEQAKNTKIFLTEDSPLVQEARALLDQARNAQSDEERTALIKKARSMTEGTSMERSVSMMANDIILRAREAKGLGAPAAKRVSPETEGWKCGCGSVNKGKFCTECGAKKPAGVPQYRCDKCGWQPDDPTKAPRFCPACGDPFDSGDII